MTCVGKHTIEICMFDTGNSGFAEKLLWPVVDKLSVDTK